MKKFGLCLVLVFAGFSMAVAQKDSTVVALVGKYLFPAGSVVPSVEVMGDSLQALTMNSEAGSSPMVALGGDRFSIPNFSGTVDFKRQENSKTVTGIHIEAMGYILDGLKEPETGKLTSIVRTKKEEPQFLLTPGRRP